ncbi:hypothetical protein RIF29_25997 [Crotalaria pallida]|uniref:Protein FAR1-RELATED SEQUENCE n=1 Tax=Crotalaria pallida TaxID=3830 RepID=A0AAN9EPN0_CROPI
MSNRKRPPKGRSRCSCKAELRIYLQSTMERWIVGYFVELHNHKLLSDYGLIHRSQCTITEAEMEEIKSMRKVGIKNPQIYAAIAERVGGYPMVGYSRKSLYNKMHGYGNGKEGDANEALKYMQRLSSTDPGITFIRLESTMNASTAKRMNKAITDKPF